MECTIYFVYTIFLLSPWIQAEDKPVDELNRNFTVEAEEQNGRCLANDELDKDVNAIYFLGKFSKSDCLKKCRQKSLAMACEWSLYQFCAYHTKKIIKGSGDKDTFCWKLKQGDEIKKDTLSKKQDNIPSFQTEAKFRKNTTREKLQQVFHSDSGLFCEEISFGDDTGDYDDAEGSLFTYTNHTDMDGFPIYFNEVDGQYMVRPLHNNQSFGDYDDTNEEVKKGNINEYIFVETSSKLDVDSKSLFLQMVPSITKPEPGTGENTPSDISGRCMKMSKQARPASSIYALWPMPNGNLDSATSWELGCTVKPLSSYLHTYFMTVGWAPGGYGGFQHTPDLKKAPSRKLALFSFWNDRNHGVSVKDVNKNDGFISESFGGEGTGQKTYTDFNWNLGEEISMKVKGIQTDKVPSRWEVSAYIKHGGAGHIPDNKCVTDGGKQIGSKCIFPFIYKGTKYNGCTLNGNSGPWCATVVDRSGGYLKNKWGNCASNCKIHGTKQVSCGLHSADSCSECGPNKSYCNGNCKWDGVKCTKGSKGVNDYAELSTSWIHMATFSRTGKAPLSNGGFSVFIEDWQRGPGEEGYLHKRSAEFRDPYLLVNGKRMDFGKPFFTVIEGGFDAFAAKYVIQKEIGPTGSGNVFMSTGTDNKS